MNHGPGGVNWVGGSGIGIVIGGWRLSRATHTPASGLYVALRLPGFCFHKASSDSLHSGTYQLSICHYSFQLKFPSAADTVLEICCVRVSGVVPFGGAWLVDLHVYCRRLISWPPCPQGFPSMCMLTPMTLAT